MKKNLSISRIVGLLCFFLLVFMPVTLARSRLRRKQASYVPPHWFLPESQCTSKDDACWNNCVAFKGDASLGRCGRAAASDLHKERPSDTRFCHVSVLHLMLRDFLSTVQEDEETAALFTPLVTLGTLLGAYRNRSIIRWTHDIDLAYFTQDMTPRVSEFLTLSLARKGYILFKSGILRVCLSSKHPLATSLMHQMGNFREAKRRWAGDIPYLDLYGIEQKSHGFVHQTLKHNFTNSSVFPLRQVLLLGDRYWTIQDPETLFRAAGYGNFWQERVETHR